MKLEVLKKIGLTTIAGFVLKQVKNNGVIGIARVVKGENNKVQFHIDRDCTEYDEVINHAKRVKTNKEST